MAVSLRLWQALTDRGERLSKFLPYLAYHEQTETFLMVDGSIASIVEFEPLPAGGIGDTEAENIAQILSNIFTFQLPDDTALQFIVMASTHTDPLLNEWKERKITDFGKTLADRRIKHLKDNVELLRYRYFFTLRVFLDKIPEEHDLLNFSHIREALITTLGAVDLQPRVLTLKEFLPVITELLNNAPVDIPYNPKYPIRDQIVFKPLHIEKEYMTVGNKYVSVITSKLPPERPDLRAPLTGDVFNAGRRIEYPFLLTVNFHIPNQEKFKAKIAQKQKVATAQASGPLALFFPKIRQMGEELYYTLDRAEKGEHFIRTYLTFITFTNSIKESRQAESKVLTILKQSGYIPQVESSIKATVFLKALPMAYETKDIEKFLMRGRTILSNEAPHLTPILGEWKGTKTPVLLYVSRKGEILTLDLFDSPGNYNAVVAAASGSGKSFFVNDIITNYLAEGGKAFVIDVGHSYRKLCELLGGEYVEFQEDKNIVLNPFTEARAQGKDENGYIINDDDLNFITLLSAKMAKGQDKLYQDEIGALEDAIMEAFRRKAQDADFKLVAEILKEKGEERLYKRILPYSIGRFSKYFNGKANIRFKKNFVVLELEALRSKKDLQGVVLLLILFHINKDIEKGDRSQRKLIVIDEAWDLLSDPFSAKFIENGYRVYRKYGAGAISITQSLRDLYQNEAGKAVADNADFYFLLRQKAESITELVESKKLLLNEAYFKLLTSLKTIPGRYSEIFFYTPLGKGVGRFMPDPFTYWLFTTKPNERAEIRRRAKEKGISIIEAVRELSEEYPNGI